MTLRRGFVVVIPDIIVFLSIAAAVIGGQLHPSTKLQFFLLFLHATIKQALDAERRNLLLDEAAVEVVWRFEDDVVVASI